MLHNGCMVHLFISLAAQSVGVPISLIAIMLMTIQFMIFRFCTSFGDLSRSYGGIEERSYQG